MAISELVPQEEGPFHRAAFNIHQVYPEVKWSVYLLLRFLIGAFRF